MKKRMATLLIFALLNFGIPVSATEISRELDPMVAPDAQETLLNESPADDLGFGADQAASDVVSAPAPVKEEKKIEKKKKGKTEKSVKKKSSEKKKKNTSEKKKKKASDKENKKSKKSKKHSY